MKKLAFDNKKYIKIQREEINKRIKLFDNKLYLEFGGKLYEDYHASRVLPGFEPNSKMQMLSTMKDDAEVVIVVNTNDIVSNKVRNDTNVSYQGEVERLIDAFKEMDLYVSSVVFSFYFETQLIESFIKKLEKNGIKTYKHYKINGYPQNIPLIVSENGLGKNEYIETTRPLVVITAPGPGSGKMATALSQLYHDNKKGIRAGYAKYETFPVWNLPLSHPINLAYEAATVDLKDVNMIDPYHLEKFNIQAVNYNRDVEVFPLLRAIFEKIYGSSPYHSPTEMGVNMAGFAIKDMEATNKACKDEIIRRYFQAKKNNFYDKYDDSCVEKIEMLMNQLHITTNDRRCVNAAIKKENKSGQPSMALELPNGKIITARSSELLSSTAALLLNAIKSLGKIDDSLPLINKNVITPIQSLKSDVFKSTSTRLHAEEILIALAIQATTNSLSEFAISQLKKLKGCQAHSSNILPTADMRLLKKLGIEVTEESVSKNKKLFIK